MTKSKTTKRALFTSVISMLLCVTMLIGSTFAWFTDTVTSGKNKIVAGNLDVEAEYNVLNENGTLSDNWVTLANADSLFNKGLWEPGHTEYAVIRIRNAGTLALNYQAKVDVITETGSINVNGEQFKLSDFLKYGVKCENSEPTDIDRTAAVGMATTGLGAYSGDSRSLDADSGYDYITLAITMPTDVDNDANYDKAYNAPSIELGISILATQAEKEKDSFGTDYDAGALYGESGFTASANVVFPVKAEGILADGANEVKVLLSATTTSGKTVSMGSVTVPAGRVADSEKPVVVEVKPTEKGNFSVSDGKEAKYYEITVSNLNANTDEITVELQLDKGLEDVVIKHAKSGTVEEITSNYNAATGMVTFQTSSFSPFMVEYKLENAAVVNGTGFITLEDALAAARADDTIELVKSVTARNENTYEGRNVITKNMVMNMGDSVITFRNDATNDNMINISALYLMSGGTTLTLNANNGGIDSDFYGIVVGASSNEEQDHLIINGGTYQAGSVVQVQKGTVTINGGLFDGRNIYGDTKEASYLLNCIDEAYKDGTAKIIVKGGTFINFDPSNNRSEGAGTNYVPEGYYVDSEKKEDGNIWYTVIQENLGVDEVEEEDPFG